MGSNEFKELIKVANKTLIIALVENSIAESSPGIKLKNTTI